jgi:hypothetical protein
MERQPKKWFGPITTCDICTESLLNYKYFIDGRTRRGPWALMCPPCWATVGTGLGTGRGQKYNTETRVKVAG